MSAIHQPSLETGGFSTALSFSDRQLLRKVVRRVHMKNYPEHLMTDREADRIIDAFGPSVSERMLRKLHEMGER